MEWDEKPSDQIWDGVPFKVGKQGFIHVCCDCGVAHDVVVTPSKKGNHVQMTMVKNRKATRKIRAKERFKLVKTTTDILRPVIDQGIPLPEDKKKLHKAPPDSPKEYSRVYHPFADMRVGESYFIPCGGDTARRMMTSIKTSFPRFPLRRFLARYTDSGIRVWRVS